MSMYFVSFLYLNNLYLLINSLEIIKIIEKWKAAFDLHFQFAEPNKINATL